MSISSNLYAEKVFSEHPIGLWTIDENLHYRSLINEGYRNIANESLWTTLSGSPSATPEENFSEAFSPFPDSGVYSLTAASNYSIVGQNISLELLDSALGSVTVSGHFKIFDGTETSISLGIKTASTTYSKTFSSIVSGEWVFLSATLDIPPADANFGVFISVVGSSSVIGLNGLSVGQWSSPYAFSSLGLDTEALPSISEISGSGVKIEAYGISSNDGYALFDGPRQLVRSCGIPIVYGTVDSVSVYENSDNKPSMVFPGLGFMNDSGKSSDYTLEFWTKINGSVSSKRRIAGPIASSDGIYVDGPFIGVSIGNDQAYHYVGEWGRPMLVQLAISETSAILSVNGENTASISISSENYPKKNDSSGASQDWIGFYAYEDFSEYQIECVAIYPYLVPEILSKRRFVYGQGVDTIASVDSSFNGVSTVFDSKFLKNSISYSYPDIGSWTQGIAENVSAGETRLSSPGFSLPSVLHSGETYNNWLSDTIENFSTIGNVASLKPNSSWDSIEGCLLFGKLSPTNDLIRAVYGVFEARQNHTGRKTLIRIFERSNPEDNYLSIDLNGKQISYYLKYNGGAEQQIFRVLNQVGEEAAEIGLGEIFAVGIDIDAFALEFGGSLAAFFGNRSSLSVSFGGSTKYEDTFTGFIHRAGFCSNRNFEKASAFFASNGTVPISQAIYDGGDQGPSGEPNFLPPPLDGGGVSEEYADTIFEYVATYTLFVSGSDGVFDIATDSYWEDYVPLSRLSRETTTVGGQKRSAVDMIQFNVDYPRSFKISGQNINTKKEIVKTYVSFQSIFSSSKTLTQLPDTVDVPKNLLVAADEDWQTTRYEVVDGCVIIPPSGVDTNGLSMNVHFEIKTPGVISKSVSIRSMSLIAKSFDYGTQSPVGTSFSDDALPYKRYGLYSTYWSTIPFSVHKNSSPYLYLTSDYGILLNSSDEIYETGMSIPINKSESSNFFVSSIGLFVNPQYSSDNGFSGAFAEIDFGGQLNYLVAQPDGFGRYRVYLANESLQEISSVVYFVNDTPTQDAFVLNGQWSSIAIAPSIPFDFSGSLGAIRILPGMRIGAISYFRMSSNDKALYDSFTQLSAPVLRSTSNQSFCWARKTGAFSSRQFGADPKEVYQSYTGTNRLVIGDESVTRFGKYTYAIYSNLNPVTITSVPI